MTTTQTNIDIRRAEDRGQTRIGWLDSKHSFSFGRYYDPKRLGFRSLRVINDDVVRHGAGFGEHGHDNMEIFTWVLTGALRHGDSLGSDQVLHPGELQAMTAGSGIRHSEFNASQTEPVHFLQIWIEPSAQNVAPRYDQRAFDADGRRGQWQTLVSSAGQGMPIAQDATLKVADLQPGDTVDVTTASNRAAYVHVATGGVRVNGHSLKAGDAFTSETAGTLTLEATEPAQVLWFDLA